MWFVNYLKLHHLWGKVSVMVFWISAIVVLLGSVVGLMSIIWIGVAITVLFLIMSWITTLFLLIGRSINSVVWSLRSFLLTLAISAVLYLLIAEGNSTWGWYIGYGIFMAIFLFLWCMFSLLINVSVGELINSGICNFFMIITVCFNLLNFSLTDGMGSGYWQWLFNGFITPFILTSGTALVLVQMKKYCLEKTKKMKEEQRNMEKCD